MFLWGARELHTDATNQTLAAVIAAGSIELPPMHQAGVVSFFVCTHAPEQQQFGAWDLDNPAEAGPYDDDGGDGDLVLHSVALLPVLEAQGCADAVCAALVERAAAALEPSPQLGDLCSGSGDGQASAQVAGLAQGRHQRSSSNASSLGWRASCGSVSPARSIPSSTARGVMATPAAAGWPFAHLGDSGSCSRGQHRQLRRLSSSTYRRSLVGGPSVRRGRARRASHCPSTSHAGTPVWATHMATWGHTLFEEDSQSGTRAAAEPGSSPGPSTSAAAMAGAATAAAGAASRGGEPAAPAHAAAAAAAVAGAAAVAAPKVAVAEALAAQGPGQYAALPLTTQAAISWAWRTHLMPHLEASLGQHAAAAGATAAATVATPVLPASAAAAPTPGVAAAPASPLLNANLYVPWLQAPASAHRAGVAAAGGHGYSGGSSGSMFPGAPPLALGQPPEVQGPGSYPGLQHGISSLDLMSSWDVSAPSPAAPEPATCATARAAAFAGAGGGIQAATADVPGPAAAAAAPLSPHAACSSDSHAAAAGEGAAAAAPPAAVPAEQSACGAGTATAPMECCFGSSGPAEGRRVGSSSAWRQPLRMALLAGEGLILVLVLLALLL